MGRLHCHVCKEIYEVEQLRYRILWILATTTARWRGSGCGDTPG